MEGHDLLFRIYRLLHGPVKEAFIYVFHQTYAHNENVYEYATQHVEYFTEVELLSLQHDKRLSEHSIPMLFTIIKSSAHPSLAHPTDNVWKENNIVKPKDISKITVENLLVKFLKMYEEIARHVTLLSVKEYNEKITDVKLWLQRLIEGGGKFDVTGRWKEALERIMNQLQDILQKKVFPVEDIADDIKMELRMSYSVYNDKGINPLFLQLSFVQDTPQQTPKKKHKHRKDPVLTFAVADLVKAMNLNGSSETRRICLIKGDPGCGRSNLASLLGFSWSQKDNRIIDINLYEIVIVVPGLLTNGKQDLCKIMLPLCSLIHGTTEIQKWLSYSRVLLVVDDAEESSFCIEELSMLIHESKGIDAIVLTSPWYFDHLKQKWSESTFLKLQLDGLGREQIIASAEQIMTEKKYDNFKEFKDFLVTNICRLELVLKYPSSLMETCEAWTYAKEEIEDITTCSDLLWSLTNWKIEKALKNALEIVDNAKLKEVLLLMGSKCLQALKDGSRLEKEYMVDLISETSKLFISLPGQTFLSHIFKNRFTHHGSYHHNLSALHHIQQQFLAGWYVANQIVDGKRLHDVFGNSDCPYHLAVFMLGLLPKIKEFKWISMLHERRLINAVVNYSKGSSEDLNFNLDLVTEVKGLLKYVEVIVDFSEYPDECNVDAGDIQLIPLQSLLYQVAPTRIFLNVEELKPYSELQKVIDFLCRVQIFFWLDSTCQFQYGNTHKMDGIAKSFFGEHVKTRIDLLKGCVSRKIVKELPSHVAFSHLVFIKLRVLDLKTLVSVLKVPRHLPKLLWLEIKIDFPILEEEVTGIPKTTAPLFDVHIQGLDEKCVSKFANLLAAMHNSYSGIHLDNTSLTPEDLFVILKQLQRKNVLLYSSPEHREKFRRWYYPQLSNFDKSIQLTDEVALKVLGFDDRIYYSNHIVSSSRFAVALDAWNLASYLEEEINIVQFTFKTDNMTCIKGLDGSVNIMVNGECHNIKKLENGNQVKPEILF